VQEQNYNIGTSVDKTRSSLPEFRFLVSSSDAARKPGGVNLA